MKLVKVIALKDHEWAKVAHHPGDVYFADAEDDRFHALLTMGLARRIDVEERRVEEPRVEEPRIITPGRYKRRDMRPIK